MSIYQADYANLPKEAQGRKVYNAAAEADLWQRVAQRLAAIAGWGVTCNSRCPGFRAGCEAIQTCCADEVLRAVFVEEEGK